MANRGEMMLQMYVVTEPTSLLPTTQPREQQPSGGAGSSPWLGPTPLAGKIRALQNAREAGSRWEAQGLHKPTLKAPDGLQSASHRLTGSLLLFLGSQTSHTGILKTQSPNNMPPVNTLKNAHSAFRKSSALNPIPFQGAFRQTNRTAKVSTSISLASVTVL